ncbi:MAG: xanthine dehydrogenase family protein molybdopterin-binding subunit, partial [Gammaproteobacteria bacterium]|nr:xanthine dehydrogenase family protein molybdopterin-binding subunit [Gammaproteobacteria bacterium]
MHQPDSTDGSGLYVGRAERTLGGDAVIAGNAKFTADFTFHGQLYAHIVRSTQAAARIRGVDLKAARKVAGVVLAMDGAGAAEYMDPIPPYIDAGLFGGKRAEVRSLALDQVWYYGQPVAVIVADDRATARYAASKVRIDYEASEPVVDAEDALREDAPRVVPGWDDNVLMEVPFLNGDAEGAFRKAHRVVETTVRIHRFSTQPIEARAYNAVWDAGWHGVDLYATAQNPHPLRNVLSQALRLPENKIRIHAPAIGGAFGLKMHGHPEEALTCMLARVTGRPVKWVETREECLLVGAREQLHRVQLAVDEDGLILGLRDHFIANTGAPTSCPGWGMAFLTGLTMPGPYAVRDIDVKMTAVTTNKPPWNAARGYGKEATALALELSIDNAARELGIDPVTMRYRNFIDKSAFPYASPTGLNYDSGDYSGATAKALEALDLEAWKAKQATARAEGRLIGIGLAYELTPEGGALPGTMVAGWDSSTVRVDPGGSVMVLTGITQPGSGNPTGIAQIVADELGVDIATIDVIQGDTTTCPYGFGNYSGRSTIVGGGSAALAAREVKGKLVTIAAALLEVPEGSIRLLRGKVTSSEAPGRELSIGEVAYAAYTRAYDIGLAITPPLEASATFRPGQIRHSPDENGRINPYPSYSNAAYATVCEVDVDTGQVKLLAFAAAHDCGKVINPVLVEGQACG